MMIPDELSHEEKLGLEDLYCRPHSRTSHSREIDDQLLYRDMMEVGMPHFRPLNRLGLEAVHKLQAAGMWPPSKHI